MKIRNGFVTNSSSSSFIIAIKGGMDGLTKNLAKEVASEAWRNFIINGIESLLDSSDNCDTESAELLFSSEAGFTQYLKKQLRGEDMDPEDYFGKDRIEFYKKAAVDGFAVYEKRVSYHDAGTRSQIRAMACDNIRIHQED